MLNESVKLFFERLLHGFGCLAMEINHVVLALHAATGEKHYLEFKKYLFV